MWLYQRIHKYFQLNVLEMNPSRLWLVGGLHLSLSWTMKPQTWIQWSPPSTQQWLKQPARSLANIVRRKKKLGHCSDSWSVPQKERTEKKRFELEGSENYKEVNNNNIKRCMKKAKENWIGEQCSEIEENLRKNNSKTAYQLVKDLTTVKQGKATTVQERSGKCFTGEREILNRWKE